MESSIRILVRWLWVVWWLFTLLYMSILFAPSRYFVDVKEFQAIDTKVGEKMHFIAIRDTKHPWVWTVIEEINISRDNITQILFRNQKEVLTEAGLRTVSREIDYIHQEPWNYELHLHITHEVGLFGIKKRILLSDTYLVTF